MKGFGSTHIDMVEWSSQSPDPSPADILWKTWKWIIIDFLFPKSIYVKNGWNFPSMIKAGWDEAFRFNCTEGGMNINMSGLKKYIFNQGNINVWVCAFVCIYIYMGHPKPQSALNFVDVAWHKVLGCMNTVSLHILRTHQVLSESAK